ncbi:ParB/RepB/Spo0J family partition protein [Plantibacter sp. CFBP 8775]|uniref:ParB/RepB/Spo0J family partition protein n=1 Tax=Plantibacter sp. CFBP 8775 TaxID=2774038 RepID=UPI00178348F0|nr:ParB N-terminal domain-containing protein [Plantibacter sp. CFBP 8775]MBD8104744.1 ParB N-terminal domain-containing protein [Plantibacter sp. CFBP 8775]
MNTTITAPAATTSVTVELIDPATAVLDENIRTNPTLSNEFLAQIRTEGVRVPVLARRGDDGTIYVWDGQRRLLAAREAGLSGILAIFGTSDASKVARITDQLTSFNRDDMSNTDRVAAFEQLALEGISVARIAKTTGTSKATVNAALTVSASATAKGALESHPITLDVAMRLAEFDGNDDAAARILEAVENGYNLDHIVQRIRDDIAINAIRDRITAEHTQQGIRAFSSNDYGQYTTLTQLTDAPADAEHRPVISIEEHTSCPGHALAIAVHGLKDSDIRIYGVCTEPQHHHNRWGGNTQSKVKLSELPDDEAEARRAERRTLIANNKAWDSAETTRRTWLSEFINRKTLPKDADTFAALTFTQHAFLVSSDNRSIADEITGVSYPYGLQKLVEATPTKAAHVTLAVAISAREHHTSRDSWRTTNAADIDYLLQLERWGYTLSPVERIAAGYIETVTPE